jgi:hypothetical protein
METTLQLVFRNELGSLFTINVASPKATLTEAEITTVMDLILTKNIFRSTGGLLVSKVRARHVSREAVDLASYEV